MGVYDEARHPREQRTGRYRDSDRFRAVMDRDLEAAGLDRSAVWDVSRLAASEGEWVGEEVLDCSSREGLAEYDRILDAAVQSLTHKVARFVPAGAAGDAARAAVEHVAFEARITCATRSDRCFSARYLAAAVRRTSVEREMKYQNDEINVAWVRQGDAYIRARDGWVASHHGAFPPADVRDRLWDEAVTEKWERTVASTRSVPRLVVPLSDGRSVNPRGRVFGFNGRERFERLMADMASRAGFERDVSEVRSL